ncbi:MULTISPECIES: NAD(P)/FAD-dependent oxidoreductase [unclassified Frigoribacterium]|uniref:dihydrolipoyl dehydrogenase family protein n=1 Tax=unclassified Frigoribacterium TaxID=2627005 RepID=UPI0006F249C5|nr:MULTISPECIES: NAD(P)/FAD-dependent oxidoreductase [unclassified Frigoribacterium]KQO46782.1 pyridine nucleotide-disulfide oxidoreductase [Frigoribacterium sp. Leaf254]KQT38875.1 pyridine nucleotide-disulfide oxidoreductase [Frigoribacterium sp. Leaf415]
MTTYDLIVIGAGAVGENVADYATRNGLKVGLVEAELVGGECSYWACMPSKALLRSSAVVRAAKSLDGAKQAVTGDVDVAAVLRRRDSFTSNWDDSGQADWVEGAGIDLIRGHATITGVKEVTVNGEVHQAKYAVAAVTGSSALLPDIPGLAEAKPWTSREATSVKSMPQSVVIVGGGVVAAEMATAYQQLGSTVTLIARSGLLGGQEPFAGELVADSLRGLGVDVRLGVSPSNVLRTEHDTVEVTLDDDSTVIADEIVVATGRVPRTSDLGLENVGLTPGEWLDVDDTMLVKGTDWLYGVGDVNHRALLTHQGKYQARAAGEVIAARAFGKPVQAEPWGAHVATADDAAVPQVTFTDPEVASVGLTADAAGKRGIDVKVVDYDLAAVAGSAIHSDEYKGQARLVVDESRKVIVGATFVGPDVSDLLHAATIAVVGEVPIDRLWHAVPSYPTVSEVWLRLLDTYGRP